MNNDIWGTVQPPVGGLTGDGLDPIVKLFNTGLSIVMAIAGVWVLINFIIAGFKYITAGGDSKNIAEANKKITLSVVGLIIIVAAPVIAAIIGIVFFGDANAVLRFKIKGI